MPAEVSMLPGYGASRDAIVPGANDIRIGGSSRLRIVRGARTRTTMFGAKSERGGLRRCVT